MRVETMISIPAPLCELRHVTNIANRHVYAMIWPWETPSIDTVLAFLNIESANAMPLTSYRWRMSEVNANARHSTSFGLVNRCTNQRWYRSLWHPYTPVVVVRNGPNASPLRNDMNTKAELRLHHGEPMSLITYNLKLPVLRHYG